MNEQQALELIKNNKPVDEIYLDYFVAKSEGKKVRIEGGKLLSNLIGLLWGWCDK